MMDGRWEWRPGRCQQSVAQVTSDWMTVSGGDTILTAGLTSAGSDQEEEEGARRR